MDTDWLVQERIAWRSGRSCVAGIDEAGRGALAGPVVAACVILPVDHVPPGVNDSKKLSKSDRETCYAAIVNAALGYGVASAGVSVIDHINILRATHCAMRDALAALPPNVIPDFVLIDGLPVLPFPIPQRAVVDGDTISASIAAASILAKVTRDRIMVEIDAAHPQYGFAQHKGYGTSEHLRQLKMHGPCPEHRRSFKPVACLLPEFPVLDGQQAIYFAETEPG